MPNAGTPVTILAGFLGAGKTTFIRRVLAGGAELDAPVAAAGQSAQPEQAPRRKKAPRVAVLQNEFGAASGADELQVRGGGDEEHFSWVELVNGCACCTVKDDMLLAVEELARRGTVGSTESTPFDHIFIECSGLADPGSLAGSLWVDPALESSVFLDAVVTFVDLKHIERHLDAPALKLHSASKPTDQCHSDATEIENRPDTILADDDILHSTEAHRQIAFADRIILNKRDLVDEQVANRAASRVREINNTALIATTVRSNVSLDFVLNVQAFDPSRTLDAIARPACGCESAALCSHGGAHSHDGRVTTAAIEHVGSVDRSAFEEWIGSLVWDNELSLDEVDRDSERETVLYRYKGVVAVTGSDRKFVLQGVHGTFEFEEAEVDWGIDEPRRSVLVFIGIGVDKLALTASFEQALVRR